MTTTADEKPRHLSTESEFYRRLVELIPREFPDMWKTYYPKNYVGVGGYGSPKFAACVFSHMEMQGHYKKTEPGLPYDVDVMYMHGATAAAGLCGVPTYFVRRELAQTALMTEPPDDLSLEEIKWPHRAMLFILPHGFLRHSDGHDYSFLLLAKLPKGTVLSSGHQEYVLGITQYIAVTGAGIDQENGLLYLSHAFLSPDRFETVGEWRRREKKPYRFLDVDTLEPVVASKDDEDFAAQLIPFGLNLLTMMTVRPELVTEEECVREHKVRKKKEQSELWSPNWIGRDYRVIRRVRPATEETGSPKRIHWTRGHFRKQRYGEGRQKEKLIWIEPFLSGTVGVEEKDI